MIKITTMILLLTTHAFAVTPPNAAHIREYVSYGKISGIEHFVDLKNNTSYRIGNETFYCIFCVPTDQQCQQTQQQYGSMYNTIALFSGNAIVVDKNLIRCE